MADMGTIAQVQFVADQIDKTVDRFLATVVNEKANERAFIAKCFNDGVVAGSNGCQDLLGIIEKQNSQISALIRTVEMLAEGSSAKGR